jgi:hypothetical protein
MKKLAMHPALSILLSGVVLTSSISASAQAPGTNVATPPPTQAPASPIGQNAPGAMTQATPTGLAPEPIIEPSATRTTYPNRPLLVTGALILAASYGGSAIVAATSDRESNHNLYYPVAGPWLSLHERDCNADHCGHDDRDRALLIGDGIVQGIGALTLVMSLFIPEKTTRNWYLIGNNNVLVVPQVQTNVLGVGAIGRF